MKLFEQYQYMKEINSDKFYLFPCGVFYIFIGEDALKMSELCHLKLSKLNDSYYKCGFPIKGKEKYIRILEENNINYEIVVKTDDTTSVQEVVSNNTVEKEIIRKLNSINVEYYTPLEALSFLKELKELLKWK